MGKPIEQQQYCEPSRKQPSILEILKPVIIVNQILGVCPHKINGELLIFKAKSIPFFKTLVTLLILSTQFAFTTFQFSKALINGHGMVKLGFLFGGMTQFLMSLLILIVTLQKRDQFTHFFVKCCEFRISLCMKAVTNCPQVKIVAWRFYGFYMLLAICQALLVAYDSLRHPTSEIYFLSIFSPMTPTSAWTIANSIFQFYLIVITESACSLVEVFCASISYSFVNSIGKIQRFMREDTDAANETKNIGGCGNNTIYRNNLKNTLIQMEDENGKNTPYGLPLLQTNQNGNCTGNKINNRSVDESDIRATEPIMTAIERYSFISQKQRLINCIFGPILALDIAWLVIHVCLLFFLQIKSLGIASSSKMEDALGNSTIDCNGTFIQEDDTQFHMIHGFTETDIDFYNETSDRIGYFAAKGLIYLVRLMIVLISLGNVHETARSFDSEITGTLLKIQEHNTQDLHLIQLHLLGSQTSPLSFSAGGFFIFSRSTILYVFSIVTTYVVFMLQA